MEAEVEAETAEAAMAVDAKNTVAADAWVGVGMDMMQVMAIVVDSVAVAEGVVVLGCSRMFIMLVMEGVDTVAVLKEEEDTMVVTTTMKVIATLEIIVVDDDLDASGRRTGNDDDVFCHGVGSCLTGGGSSGKDGGWNNITSTSGGGQ